jgi:hypothetical protein
MTIDTLFNVVSRADHMLAWYDHASILEIFVSEGISPTWARFALTLAMMS